MTGLQCTRVNNGLQNDINFVDIQTQSFLIIVVRIRTNATYDEIGKQGKGIS